MMRYLTMEMAGLRDLTPSRTSIGVIPDDFVFLIFHPGNNNSGGVNENPNTAAPRHEAFIFRFRARLPLAISVARLRPNCPQKSTVVKSPFKNPVKLR